jgi:arylsulfatase
MDDLIPLDINLAKLTLFSLMFSLGITLRLEQVLLLWQRPGLLNRSILAIVVIVPMLVALVVLWVRLPPEIQVGLILIAIAPGTSLTRGVLHCWADGKGGQQIEDTGPLTKKRMETIGDEVLVETKRFIGDAKNADQPFFIWFNTTHMHFRTHCKPESKGQSGRWQSEYHDTMIDHDKIVGELLDQLDELGIAEDTIVMYSTDNGPHMNTWPDGGMTPFRNEKNSNWEGAYRVPVMVRWPGQIEAGSVCNGLVSHLDWLPTLLAVAGEPDIKQKLLNGHQAGSKTFKIHLDGYNMLDYWTGKTDKSPRTEFFYFSDDGDLTALRYENWKLVFAEQRVMGTLQVWAEPFVPLRVPKMFNLVTDPYERADVTSNTYWDWLLDRAFLAVPAQAYVAQFLETFKDYPPRQKAASFSIDQVMAKLEAGLASP